MGVLIVMHFCVMLVNISLDVFVVVVRCDVVMSGLNGGLVVTVLTFMMVVLAMDWLVMDDWLLMSVGTFVHTLVNDRLLVMVNAFVMDGLFVTVNAFVVDRFFMVVDTFVMNGLFMVVCALVVNRNLVMHDWARVMVVLLVVIAIAVGVTAAAADLNLLVVRLRGLSLHDRLGLLLLRGGLHGLWALGTRVGLVACAVVVLKLDVLVIGVRVGVRVILSVMALFVMMVSARLTVSVLLSLVSVKSMRLDLVINVTVTHVFGRHDLLVGLLNLTSFTFGFEDSATLLTRELLLLLLALPDLLLSLAVEEGLNLVLVMVQLKLLLAHVRVSDAEFFVLDVSVSLLVFDITQHLG